MDTVGVLGFDHPAGNDFVRLQSPNSAGFLLWAALCLKFHNALISSVCVSIVTFWFHFEHDCSSDIYIYIYMIYVLYAYRFP